MLGWPSLVVVHEYVDASGMLCESASHDYRQSLYWQQPVSACYFSRTYHNWLTPLNRADTFDLALA